MVAAGGGSRTGAAAGRPAFEDTGGDGPPVLLTHGTASDRSAFAPQLSALSDVYRVVAWDRADGGASPQDLEGPPVEAAEVFSVLDHVGIERAVLGGAGSGAQLSLWAALRQPDRVRALVLIDPPNLGTEAAGDLADRVEELPMPILLVSGHEIATHGSSVRQIADRVEDCRGVLELPGAPHPVTHSRAGEVNDAVRAFLESLPA